MVMKDLKNPKRMMNNDNQEEVFQRLAFELACL